MHQDDGAVVEHEVSVANPDTEALREATEAFELGAVAMTQPHLPPHDRVRGGEIVGGVGPQRFDGGEPYGGDSFDEVAVARCAGSCVLGGVLLEALQEVAQLPVGNEHRRPLHDLVADDHALHGEQLGLIPGALRVEGRGLQVEAREAIEHDVDAVAGGGDADCRTSLASAFVAGGGGGLGGAS